MFASVHLIMDILTVLPIGLCQPQGVCPDGWFGPNCKFMCHCNRTIACSYTDGFCTGGEPVCAYGYFGPGCQYLDLCSRLDVGTPTFLSDCDDTTCNPNPGSVTVHVNFTSIFKATFFRIVVNNASALHKFSLTQNMRYPCPHERRYYVSETEVDINCADVYVLWALTVTGEAAGSLCSLRMALGRNFALKERTTQSSNSSTFPERGLSLFAVDGNRRNIYDNMSSCSQTGVEFKPTWRIFFERPVIMSHLEIYNRDILQDKLIRVCALRLIGDQPYSDATALAEALEVYRLIPNIEDPFDNMKITIPISSEMTLCEVEAYGEVWCDDGIWGLSCEHQCTCRKNESCNVNTGACSSRCPAGSYSYKCKLTCSYKCIRECSENWGLCECRPYYSGDECITACPAGVYGYKCQFNCSKHCDNGQCDPIDGSCTCSSNRTRMRCEECPGATYGEECEFNCSKYCRNKCDSTDGRCTCLHNRQGMNCSECPIGKFGEDCSLACPLRCDNLVCDIETGACLSCSDNYTGVNCTDCPYGKFSENCTLDCPSNCANNSCDRKTAACFSCIADYTGLNCTDCPLGRFGEHCQLRCSISCKDRLCHATTLKCFSCVSGYEGDFCDKETEHKMPILFMILLLLPLITMICMCCIVGAKAKDNPEEEE